MFRQIQTTYTKAIAALLSNANRGWWHVLGNINKYLPKNAGHRQEQKQQKHVQISFGQLFVGRHGHKAAC